MTLRGLNLLRFSGKLLNAREWVYLSGLLVPFIIYSTALKLDAVLTIGSTWDDFGVGSFGLVPLLCMMWPEVSFNVGYALLWIGLFAAVRRGLPRRVVVVCFHTATVVAGIAIACGYYYFKQTGNTLDYRAVAMWLPQFEQIMPMMIHGVPHSAWVLLTAVCLYAVFGPWFTVRLIGRYAKLPQRVANISSTTSFSSPVVLCSLALGFGLLSSLPPVVGPMRAWFPEPLIPSRSVTADPLVNLVRTAIQEKMLIRNDDLPEAVYADLESDAQPTNAKLLSTGSAERRNVVIIQLESTRARSVTPYHKSLRTTPFLNRLAKSSLVAEQAYAVVPWSSKANVAIQCGISPQLADPVYGYVTETRPGSIPTRCLADLLKGKGYSTEYFTSATAQWEHWPTLVANMGYENFRALENMNQVGYQEVNYPGTGQPAGYEDNIMLKPSRKWLEERSGEPFIATYHTTTPHDAYVVPDRYEESRFAEDEDYNRYLNTLRYQDHFLKNLFRQYKELGLYKDTVFVIVGDHGESFGEHGLYTHGFSLYEEGLRVPMLIHDPQQPENGSRVTSPTSQLDILPTVADLLGYEIEGGTYLGNSLLDPLPKDRTLVFGCMLDKCLASLKGSKKYIYYHGEKPAELYDLSSDPLERNNLADETSDEYIRERTNELLAWRLKIDAIYERSDN